MGKLGTKNVAEATGRQRSSERSPMGTGERTRRQQRRNTGPEEALGSCCRERPAEPGTGRPSVGCKCRRGGEWKSAGISLPPPWGPPFSKPSELKWSVPGASKPPVGGKTTVPEWLLEIQGPGCGQATIEAGFTTGQWSCTQLSSVKRTCW